MPEFPSHKKGIHTKATRPSIYLRTERLHGHTRTRTQSSPPAPSQHPLVQG